MIRDSIDQLVERLQQVEWDIDFSKEESLLTQTHRMQEEYAKI
jgi:hypothetical protein